MGFSVVYLIGMAVLGLVLISGIWVGIIVLRNTGRSASWWVMLVGMFLFTFGGALYAVLITRMLSGFAAVSSSGTSTARPDMAVIMGMGVCMLGALFGIIMFGAGFAMHAFRMVQLARRAADLEMLCASMAANSSGAPLTAR